MNRWNDALTSTLDEIMAWARDQSWATAMRACVQDSQWHAEGDVWTHTTMVANELSRLNEWDSLDQLDQVQLIFTALFHDAGKPATTVIDPDTGRTRSPKHALIGSEIAREVLRELGCPLSIRESICNLVRYHGRPPYLLEKTDTARAVISTSLLCRNRLLYLFAMADTLGRVTQDFSRSEETLEMWKLEAQEYGCWDHAYRFENDHARFLYFRNENSNLHYAPIENHRSTVVMMSGLPGAGKDTWLRQHRSHVPVVSLDQIRHELKIDPEEEQGQVIQLARERCREFLRDGRTFAFNATNTMELTRKRWIDLFADYNARIEIVYLEPSLTTIFHQNKNREARIPQKVIEKLIAKLEPPTMQEAHHVSWNESHIEHT